MALGRRDVRAPAPVSAAQSWSSGALAAWRPWGRPPSACGGALWDGAGRPPGRRAHARPERPDADVAGAAAFASRLPGVAAAILVVRKRRGWVGVSKLESVDGGVAAMPSSPLRVAVVCSSNQNRSMEAHNILR